MFVLFMLWVCACWVVYQLTVRPLQPDRLEDDLGDVDLRRRPRVLSEASWWDDPIVNVTLSRRVRR